MSQENESHEEERELTVGFVVGKIVDELENPLEGVRVTTNDSATYSDAKGEFVIGDRPELNPHQLMAYLDGFALQTEELDLLAGKWRDVPFKLARIPVCVSGVVKECGTETPLEGVLVCLDSPNKPCATTENDGSYRLCDEPRGYYTLTATRADLRDYSYYPVKIPRTNNKNFCMKKL